MGRAQDRRGFDEATRIALLEGDVDEIADLVGKIAANTTRIVWAVATAAITFGGTALLLAFQIGVVK